MLLAVFGFFCLVGLDAALKYGLWGEFSFALVVMSAAIWLLAHALPNRDWVRFRIQPPKWWQAPIWAAFVLVALPLAIVSRPTGSIVFVTVAAGSYLALLRLRRSRPAWGQASSWLSASFTLVVMLLFVWLTTAARSEGHVPKAATATVAGSDDLAWQYRPILRFDSRERFAPLNIRHAILRKEVDMCRDTISGERCEEVSQAGEIDANFDYLKFSTQALGVHDSTGGPDSGYYYHIVRDKTPGRTYIDYWWYFAQNPEPVAKRVLCGPGLRTPEVSCFEHPADWEGLTIILAPCATTPEVDSSCTAFSGDRLHVTEVHYAQHNHVIDFTWKRLQELWSRLPSSIERSGERPLVFVALNSHASYPLPCPRRGRRSCGRESGYDGRLVWGNNTDEACSGSSQQEMEPAERCLQPLPVTANGEPALWNAFPGPWGAQKCILAGAYCDVSPAPRAPSFHGRYDDPAAFDRRG